MDQPKNSIAPHGANVLRGVLMGGADIVPGVSGGTVALVLGVYERLVTAISHFELQFVGLLRGRRWKRAAMHVDLPFLIPLGMGILLGFVIMTTLMHYLLSTDATRSLTMAMFFGLILASGVVVASMIEACRGWRLVNAVVLGVGGAAVAGWLAGLETTHWEDPNLFFLFVAGAIAICAMILPGISGAMILWILGAYTYLTGIPKNILQGVDMGQGLLSILVFAMGCAVGLITFSKFLHWLLERHHTVTMAVLCGFMMGSLRKLGPFQHDLTPDIEKFSHKLYKPFMPGGFDSRVLAVLVVIAVAMSLVFAVDWFTHGHLRRRIKADSPGPTAQ